tara:strand:- start:138 stop:356 length:219 start_codon:yes stop_codon:yes gene_type:complete
MSNIILASNVDINYFNNRHRDMHEFNEKMKMCLNNSDFCVRIGQNGFEFSKNKHMPKNRVEYMIEKMNERRI